MTHDAHTSDATTVTPAQAARPAQAPPAGAPPGRAGGVAALFWVGLIALLVLSLSADRPEGVALALIAAAVGALRVRARRVSEPDDDPVTDEFPVPPESTDGFVGWDGPGPPRPVVIVAVLALLQIPVLAGIGATTLVFVDALASPTGGATPTRIATVVSLLALVAVPSLAAAFAVWRGSEEGRTALIGVCRVRTRLSAVSCVAFFTMLTPLVLLAIDHVMRRQLEDQLTRQWCALSPAPGPGSPPR